MRSFLNEEGEQVYSEAHAKELLNVQAWYNNELKRLNDQLAKKKSDISVKYMKADNAAKSAPSTTTPEKQTGTVTTAGQPVSASGNPPAQTVESYPNILRIKDLSEEFVDKFAHIPMKKRNWYQTPNAQPGYDEWEEEQEKLSKTPRKKKLTSKVQNQIWDIEGQIDDLKNEIKLINQRVESPNYEEIEVEIEHLERKLSQLEEMYESVNEAEFNTVNADPYELQDLKDYLDAENISYSEDVSGESIDFDETELDKEWQDRMGEMGLEEIVSDDEPKTDDILTIDDGDSDSEEDFSEEDEKIDEDKVFYVKVEDEGEAFVGKIYKLFDEGDWRSKIVDGDSETFEQLNYDPSWDSIDIISFLRENYADAELLSEDEYNKYIEDSKEKEVIESLHTIPTLDEFVKIKNETEDIKKLVNESIDELKESQLALQQIFDYFMKVDVSKLDRNKEVNRMFLRGYEGKPVPTNVNSGTPNFVAWQAGRKRYSGKIS